MTELKKSLAEKLAVIKAEREILIPNSMDEACQRYVDDLKFILDRDIKFNNPVLMLSGGVDSMMLGCILKKYYGLTQSITCGSAKDTDDITRSHESAKILGIEQNSVFVTWDEVLDNLPLCRGHNIATIFDVVLYLVFYLCLKKANVEKLDLIMGDGADTLLGSVSSFIYMDSTNVMKHFNIPRNEAQTLLKQNYYSEVLADPEQVRRRKGSGHLYKEICYELGANPIMPFKNPDIVRWVNDLDSSFSKPQSKLFPKEVIRYLGFNPDKVSRTSMQQGTGLYEKMKEHMMQLTGTKSPNSAVKKYMQTTGTIEGL